MIGEEFGLVGNLFILLILSLLIAAIIMIRKGLQQVCTPTCVGVAIMIFIYVFNIAWYISVTGCWGTTTIDFLRRYGDTDRVFGLGVVTSAVVHDRPEPTIE